MRSLILVLLLSIMVACGAKNDAEVNTDVVQDSVDLPTKKTALKPIAKAPEKVASVDSLQGADSIKLLLDSIETQFGVMHQKLVKRFTLNDTLDYILFTRSDKSCLGYFLASIMGDTLHEEAQIGAQCDKEEGALEYTWVEPVKDDSSGTFWLEIQTYVADTFLNDDGELREGFGVEDLVFINDTVVMQYLIQPNNGSIHSINLNDQKDQ